jgi:hypothetical protein
MLEGRLHGLQGKAGHCGQEVPLFPLPDPSIIQPTAWSYNQDLSLCISSVLSKSAVRMTSMLLLVIAGNLATDLIVISKFREN